MNKLMLNTGEFVYFDESFYEGFSRYKWHKTFQGYAARRKTIAQGISCIVTMHEEVLKEQTSRGGMMIDHIDQDKLNNRRDNLRLVSNQQNQLNRRKTAKGVSYDKLHGKYKAYYDHCIVGKPKRRINLGTYTTETAALEAVAQYKEKLL